MSKRALKKYVAELKKKDLEAQILDLYERFIPVKKYYDFVFNPKEDKLVQEAKMKIKNEYFPLRRKRPRARRSIAQKYIKHFRLLNMDPILIADVMLYNLEIAQGFSKDKNVPSSFYKSMLNSFEEVTQYISLNSLLPDFKDRILNIYRSVNDQKWEFRESFSRALDVLE